MSDPLSSVKDHVVLVSGEVVVSAGRLRQVLPSAGPAWSLQGVSKIR